VNDTRDAPPGLPELRAEFPDIEVSLGGLDAALLRRAAKWW